jgi:hypothetical protein
MTGEVKWCIIWPYVMVAHVVTRHFCFYHMPIQTHHRRVNCHFLVWVHPVKLLLNSGVRFQLCQSQNMLHFLLHGKHTCNWSKVGCNSAV